MQRLVAGFIWIALLPLSLPAAAKPASAKPERVPVFDVAPSCLQAREYAGVNRNLTYQGCMKDENDARAELVRKWRILTQETARIVSRKAPAQCQAM